MDFVHRTLVAFVAVAERWGERPAGSIEADVIDGPTSHADAGNTFRRPLGAGAQTGVEFLADAIEIPVPAGGAVILRAVLEAAGHRDAWFTAWPA